MANFCSVFRIFAFLAILIGAIFVVSLPAGASEPRNVPQVGDGVGENARPYYRPDSKNLGRLYIAYLWTRDFATYRTTCLLLTPNTIDPTSPDQTSALFFSTRKNSERTGLPFDVDPVSPRSPDLRGVVFLGEVPGEVTFKQLVYTLSLETDDRGKNWVWHALIQLAKPRGDCPAIISPVIANTESSKRIWQNGLKCIEGQDPPKPVDPVPTCDMDGKAIAGYIGPSANIIADSHGRELERV